MSVTDDIAQQLDPVMTGDLLVYIGAVSGLFQIVEDYASDDGIIPGWSLLVDIDRAPDEALPWLAQLVGVQLKVGLSAADQRQQIAELGNLSRGTPAAMKAAPAPFLTGAKTVILRERFDGTSNDAPAYLQVITYTSETPDPVAVLAALIEQKPAGIVMTYSVNNGQDYLSVRTGFADYTALRSHYTTYEGVRSDQVGI